MIESVSDIIQLLVLVICFALAIVHALRIRNTTWVTIVCFFGCTLLGSIYWLGYLLVFGETPHYSYIAEMGWIASYVFLLMLVVENDKRRSVSAPVYAAWIPVAVCGILCIHFIVTTGSPLLNLADNGLMAALGFFAVKGLAATRPEGEDRSRLAYNKAFHGSVLAFVAVEQAVWLASCFLEPGPIETVNIYIVLSYVLTSSYAFLLASAWKSTDA